MTTLQGLSIIGRFVQGSITEVNKTDMQNRPLPEDKWSYFYAVAVRKDAPGAADTVTKVVHNAWHAYAQHPHVQTAIGAVAQDMNHPNFSLKIEDGDTHPKLREKPDIFGGCFVFKFGGKYPPRCFNAQNQEIPSTEIKRGYYVEVAFSTSENGNTDHTAGVYLNAQGIRLVAFGTEIISGPSAEQMFGNAAPTYLPPGASTTPPSPSTAMPGSTPPTPGGAPQGAPGLPPGVPGASAPPAPPSAPPAAPPGPQRPTDPTHIHAPGTPGEMWWINGAWTPAPSGPAAPPAAPPGVPGATGPNPTLPPAGGYPTATSSPTNQGVPPHPGILTGPPSIPGR